MSQRQVSRRGQVECVELPARGYFQKPINEGAAVIDLLTFDSNPSMLDAADQRSTVGEINPNISKSHEDNLTRYLSNASGEGFRVSACTTRYVVNETRGEQTTDCMHIAPPDGLSQGEGRFHHASGFVHVHLATILCPTFPPSRRPSTEVCIDNYASCCVSSPPEDL